MEAFAAIQSRRSIRKYAAQSVSSAITEQLLRAAMSAPSAGNRQPWSFVVVNERHGLDEIVKVVPSFGMLKEATLAVLVCGDLSRAMPGSTIWVQGCSAATQNILVAANALGLGAVWLGVFPTEDKVNGLRKHFSLPDGVTPFSLISMGYPGEQKPPEDRYDSARVHFNKW